ncbi:WYL domain-containing protein [Faecalicatena contorta]|uniref:WYL domain-containing protein n=1 Tax=Faecalicatena contorta TaxID=39482 RepID=UPI001961F1C6|nr:WYL domain-containing protein [Faecalicatena contorta]MBM6684965.1 WYL domain-containing protein [Faecalicatena contorta]MBM6710493.1 WYL domain-containing protein [Faecalicatena contorta]
MAYSELIKNFNRIRDYMREFYVYGFKSRDEYTQKSARSYDDERRRLESWLGDYMQFRQTPDGKNVFISVDSRTSSHNPLYKAWKAKSFTDGDITLHFIIFDILCDPGVSMTLGEVMERIDDYLSGFPMPRTYDESTVRKKLKEYAKEGIIETEKKGRRLVYRRARTDCELDRDMLDFFSETSPCGVIGSFLLDKLDEREDYLSFKHHYITSAMDSEILCDLFAAMGERRRVILENMNRHTGRVTDNPAVPLRIMVSVQSGRQYLMAYSIPFGGISSFRIDNLISVKMDRVEEHFEEMRAELDRMLPHMWGVSTQNRSGQPMEHVEFTIRYRDDETHIPLRLEREKRIGTVEHLDGNTSRFTADVYDASEMVPWIRTFICRIVSIHISDRELEEQFRDDIRAMYELYGLEGGEKNDLQ